MKRLSVFLLVVVMLTGCSNGDMTGQEGEQARIDALTSEVENLKVALDQANEEKMEAEAALVAMTSVSDDLAEVNSELEEQVVSLTADVAELEEMIEKSNSTPSVISVAETVIELIEDQDFQGLSAYVHPSYGVRLTPYPFINLGSDQVMTAGQVAAFPTDTSIYNWGNYDGSGDPINLTSMDYYNEFIYDHDFATPEMMSWNSPIGFGNMINNMAAIYPAADYVEFHFSGFDPQYDGMDWSSLTLVFELSGSQWYLVGIVHGQWTT